MAWNPFAKKPKVTVTSSDPTYTPPPPTSGTANWQNLISNGPMGGATPFGALGGGRGVPGQNPFQIGAGSVTRGMMGSINAVQRSNIQAQQAAQAAAAQTAADKTAKDKADQDAQQKLIREMTARRLMMLRQGVQGQQGRNINLLRRHLAQRGALDSGSLGAGTTSLGNESSNILAAGTQSATLNESDAILALMGKLRDRQWGREDSQTDYDRKQALMRLAAQLDKENQPSGIELFLQGLGGAAGNAIPSFLQGMGDDD